MSKNKLEGIFVNYQMKLSLIGIILRWGFLIREIIFFIHCGIFVLIVEVFVLFLQGPWRSG